MDRFHHPSDSGIDMQLGDSVAEVMNANRRPEPHRTVVWEPEPEFHHTDGYPVSGNMDDIVKRLKHQDGVFVQDSLLHEAAAEIERLREAGDALAQGIRTGRWDDALDTWTEVRGG
jgi:hypothetical protein